jgi:carboxymethylenebutenolidase
MFRPGPLLRCKLLRGKLGAPFKPSLGLSGTSKYWLALLFSFLCLTAGTLRAQAPPSEYATFNSHGKPVSCPAYETHGAKQTMIFLRGTTPAEITFGREEASFFADHGFRVLLPDYLSVTPNAKLTAANYRRWAQVVEDMVADLSTKEHGKKIILAGQSLGASVALVAATRKLEVAAMAEWSGQLPNEFFAQVQTMPPLFILHGDLDNQIPIVNARQLVRLCELKDFTCDIQIYTGEGNIFTPHIATNANQRVLTFLQTYLSK